jgi:hypothetical protein
MGFSTGGANDNIGEIQAECQRIMACGWGPRGPVERSACGRLPVFRRAEYNGVVYKQYLPGVALNPLLRRDDFQGWRV